MGQSLKDIGSIMVLLGCDVADGENNHCKKDSWIAANFEPKYLIIVSFIPFWFRFWQCMKKQYKLGFLHENNTQLWNAGKYASKLIPPFILLMNPRANKQNEDGTFKNGFALYIIFNLIATFYCSFWDYYYDWGLCRSRKSGSYGLREKRTFKPIVYYLAILEN